MDPVPETKLALAELAWGQPVEVVTQLQERLSRARELVPDLVGASLTALREGLTFTFVASSDVIATLDGIQYLDGGPCVDAVHDAQPVDVPDVEAGSEEDRWQLFSRAESVAGIGATLSLPVLEGGRAVAGVNLYAAAPDAFQGRHDDLARVFGAWAAGAVTNADLSFSTRREAAKAPQKLRALRDIDVAVGIVAATQNVTVEQARRRLEAASALAGVPVDTLAKAVRDELPPPRR